MHRIYSGPIGPQDQRRRQRTSWTGTELRRRQQGTCRPPTHRRDLADPYTIPAGTPCHVRRVSEARWRPYVTRRQTGHQRYETLRQGQYTFRDEGYLILVHEAHVRTEVPQ